MQDENRVQWVYSAQNNSELTDRYDEWAKTYDADLQNDFAYIGPQLAVGYFVKYVPKDARILDAGAGTGMVGEILAKHGYTNLTAMDMSPGMLAEAEKKGVYRELYRMVMGERLEFGASVFDATICVGTLTVGHAPAKSLEELVRITTPQGYIVFTLRPDIYENNGFKEIQSSMETDGRWKLIEVSEPTRTMPKGEPEVYHQVWVYEIL